MKTERKMRILFKMTSRSRRENFLRAIDSVIENLSDKENYYIYSSIDSDDDKMSPLPQLSCNHTFIAGKSKSKIHAINRDLDYINNNYEWDLLINLSDDVVFIEKGFDDIIRNDFDNLDQVIHYPDGNRNDLLTVSIIGRDYYNRDKYIYNPEYKSLYCDNEAMEVAKQRGCYKYVDRVIFNHLHPAYSKGAYDAQYAHTESFSYEDRITYLKRKENNFGL